MNNFTEEEKKIFSKMGKNSAIKRGFNTMTNEEKSAYMKRVRSRQSIKQPQKPL